MIKITRIAIDLLKHNDSFVHFQLHKMSQPNGTLSGLQEWMIKYGV
jgi:hypothetical protein